MNPVIPIDEEQSRPCCELGSDQKGQKIICILINGPTQKRRHDAAVAEAGNRKKLEDAM